MLVACSDGDNRPPSLAQSVASNVADTLLPGKFRIQNLPGSYSVLIGGSPAGKYWDQHGRIYGLQLSLWCSGRDATVRLRFPTGLTGANPLPPRGELRAALTIDEGPARWVQLGRPPGLVTVDGGLSLVRQLLDSERVVLQTTSFEGQTISGEFDTRGLRDAVGQHDYFCKQQWLSRTAVETAAAPRSALRPDAGELALRREEVRAKAANLDGVTSVIWLGDGTLMLGMGNATNQQMAAAALDACDALRTYAEFPPRVEVQDTRATRDRTMRVTCPD